MADDLCSPFAPCDGLDGRLLITRTADGPSLAVDVAQIPFGPVSMAGATLHPYVSWTYGQTWKIREACLGPVRSVLGLAPGETVTIEVTHLESVDVSDLVREAAERSDYAGRTERTDAGGAASQQEATAPALSPREQLEREVKERMVELMQIHYKEMGSPFIELIVGSLIESAAGQKKKEADHEEAVREIEKHLAHEQAGGDGTINAATLNAIDEILEEVHRAETRSTSSEHRSTSRSTTEQRVKRTFSNPYSDRCLELRFSPVFRRFEVTTSLVRGEPGLLLRPGVVNFNVPGVRAKLGRFIETRVKHDPIAATAAADPGQEQELSTARRHSAVTDHLTTHAPFYTRRLMEHMNQSGDRDVLLAPLAHLLGLSTPGRAESAKGAKLADGLAWSRATVRSGELHVPLAERANWPAEWASGPASNLGEVMSQTIKNPVWLAQWTRTRNVHLFMGTHVEAVAGTCVLADLPPTATS